MTLPLKSLVRDLAIVALTAYVWPLAAALDTGSAAGVAGALLAAVLVAVAAFLLHEWGHLVGALAGGSAVHYPRGFSPFLFNYDSDRNSREQFLWMSYGGFIVSGVTLLGLVLLLPLGHLFGQAAMTLATLGVIATIVLEVPPCWKVYRGAPLPTGTAYHSERGAAG